MIFVVVSLGVWALLFGLPALCHPTEKSALREAQRGLERQR